MEAARGQPRACAPRPSLPLRDVEHLINPSRRRWPGSLVPFGFADYRFRYPPGGTRPKGYSGELSRGWEACPENVRAAHRLILAGIAAATGIDFREVRAEDASLVFAMSPGVKEWGYGFHPPRGFVFHHLKLADRDWSPRTRLFCHGLHEAQHGLGLTHARGRLDTIDLSTMAQDWGERDAYPDRPLPPEASALMFLYFPDRFARTT